MRKEMKTRVIKSFVLSFLFCSLSVSVWGQNKLDKLNASNDEIRKEISDLKKRLGTFRDSIRRLNVSVAEDSLLLKDAEARKYSMEQLNSKEYLAKLTEEIAAFDSTNKARARDIEEQKKVLEAKRQQLDSCRAYVSRMEVFAEELKKEELKGKMQYTQSPFSQMDAEKLQNLLEQSEKYSGLKSLYDEYVKRLRYAKAMLDIYRFGNEVIDSPYDGINITYARDSITTPSMVTEDNLSDGIFKLTQEQYNELDSLDIKLSRFMNGMIKLQEVIADVNKKIENNKDKDLNKLIESYREPKEGTEYYKIYNRYFNMVPYLKKLLDRYLNEKQKNPNSHSDTEDEILKTIV